MSNLGSFLGGALLGAAAIATAGYFFTKADEEKALANGYDDDDDGLEPESGNPVPAEE
jgi:hypothetical protein